MNDAYSAAVINKRFRELVPWKETCSKGEYDPFRMRSEYLHEACINVSALFPGGKYGAVAIGRRETPLKYRHNKTRRIGLSKG